MSKDHFIRRRDFLRLAMLSAGTTVLAACGAAPSAPANAPTAATAPTAAAAAPGATPGASAAAVAAGAAKEIEFMHIHGGKPGETVTAIVDAYNSSQQQFRVKATFVQGSYEGILERLQALVAARKLPAVTQSGFQYTLFMEQNMPIAPLQPFVERDQFPLDKFFPSMISLGKSTDGKQQIAVPFAVSTPVLYYNADLFKAAGLNLDAPPKTWDEVRATAQTLTRGDVKGIYYYYGITGNWLVQAMVESAGGRMLSEDSKRITFNEEPGIRAMSFWNGLVQDGLMPLLTVDQAQQSFLAGKIAMWVSTTASLGQLRNDAKFPLLTALFPTDGVHERRVAGGGNNLFMLTQDKDEQEAAWDFIKFTTSPENAAKVSREMGYMVTRQDAKESPALMGDYLQANPPAAVTYEQLPNMVRWTNFPGNSGTRVHKILQDNIQAMFIGQKTSEQALNDAAAEGQQLLG